MMGVRGNKKGQRGQVAILFALIFTFMFVLFAFVVDFGHLVHDRINLQLAADAAAYSGASWQARLLNQMATINFRMRQDIKEMAFRVQVAHTRHNLRFPSGREFLDGPDQLARGYFPFMCQQAHGYVALTGVKYKTNTNLCRNASPEFGGLPPIIVPPVIAGFDPFTIAIRQQILKIQEKALEECRAAAQDNRILTEHLASVYANRSSFHAGQMQSMATFLNQIDDENPSTSTHPAVASAFQSAVRNLTPSNTEGFKFTILKPQGGNYLSVEPQNLNATLFYYDFQATGNSCIAQPAFLNVNNIVAGFNKRSEVLTYFAVKLEATPKMLFMPETWVAAAFPKIEAYSVAKPFGSRLGPAPAADQLMPIPNRPGNQSKLINFSVKPRDTMGIMNAKLMAYLDALLPLNSAGRPDGNQATGWPTMDRSAQQQAPLQAMRAPNIFDAAFYTVFPDPGDNINDDYLEPDFALALYPDYMEAAGPDNQLIEVPTPDTAAYLPGEVGSKNRGTGWIQVNSDRSAATNAYGDYAEESLGSHSTRGPSSLVGIQNREAEFGFASKELIHSGWAPRNTSRIGYSVKFVGLNGIMEQLTVRRLDGGTSNIDNPPTGSPDLIRVLH